MNARHRGPDCLTALRPTVCDADFMGRLCQALTLVVALFALVCQTVLVRAHVHPHAAVASVYEDVTAADPHSAVRRGHPPQDQPSNCPICEELAHADAYITPQLATITPPPQAEIWVGATPHRGPSWSSRSHAWRSRAPPHPLQA